MTWRDVPLPRRMRALQRDERGYPIPFIVLRDRAGVAHFAINDIPRSRRCIKERRCPICGGKLDRTMWLVGGPVSALTDNGGFRDTAMHRECMEYALRVCPYLALRSYTGTVTDVAPYRVAPEPEGVIRIFKDESMTNRPPLFVAIETTGQLAGLEDGVVVPVKPVLAVEYWQHGERLPEDAGRRIAEEWVRDQREWITRSAASITQR